MSSRRKFTVISTFSGCGGSSLGYKLAGGKVLLAVEWDDNAVETYRLNFPRTPIYRGDIAKLTVDECCSMAGVKPGEVDILDGSPPCQGFSTAGKRDIADDRNQLFHEFSRLLRGLQPKAFVMENVSGMVKGKMRLVFVECLRELKAAGYRVKARVLNAMYFDVPQARRRLIFIGVREELGIEPSHPKGKTRPITPREALAGCRSGEVKVLPRWLQSAAKIMEPGNYSGKNAEMAFSRIRGRTSGCINTKLLSWDRVACTLVKSEIAATGIIHPDRSRYLTVEEMMRVGSFPDDFLFSGTRRNIVSCIGNSVPPSFMRAIAEHVNKTILASKKAKRA